jgi:hypothetical protein
MKVVCMDLDGTGYSCSTTVNVGTGGFGTSGFRTGGFKIAMGGPNWQCAWIDLIRWMGISDAMIWLRLGIDLNSEGLVSE